MPKPRFLLDVRTNEPIAICCDDAPAEGHHDSEDENNCIFLDPLEDVYMNYPRGPWKEPEVPYRRVTARPGKRILMFHEFRSLDELLNMIPRLAETVPKKEPDGVILLAVRGVRRIALRRLAPLKEFVKIADLDVVLTVLD